MQKLFLAGVALLFSAPGFAADLPVVPAPAPVAYPSWTGFYIGVHAGAAWQSFSSGSINDPNGFLASGLSRAARPWVRLVDFRPATIGSSRPPGSRVSKAIFRGPRLRTSEEDRA